MPLLALLVVAQLGVVAWLALSSPHNGWVWYSGGDATEYWTGQYATAHGFLVPTYIGFGIPVYYAWMPLVTGASLLVGLPLVVLFNVLVLGPLAVVLVWALADRLYGRLYAWATTALWCVSPFLLTRAFAPSFRPRLEQWFLAPHWAGLTDMADFPSMVLVLATAWLAVRAVDTGRLLHAVEAGVAAGVVIALKPGNGFFLIAVGLLLVLTRRPLVAAGVVAGLVPALVTLAVWKKRGLGYLPLNAAGAPHREAAGPLLAVDTSKYVTWNAAHWHQEMSELREIAWSVRFIEFLIVAGIVGAVRRHPAKGLFLAAWFLLYVVLKGDSLQADIGAMSYFRLTEPGLVAFVFLITAIGFLWPRAHFTRWRRPAESVGRLLRPSLAGAAVVALVPLVVVAALAVPKEARTVRVVQAATEAPITDTLTPSHAVSGHDVQLSWAAAPVSGSTRVSYHVFRSANGSGCDPTFTAAAECGLLAPVVGTTSGRSFVDHVQPGSYGYWVAAAADYTEDPQTLDVMMFGRPTTVVVK